MKAGFCKLRSILLVLPLVVICNAGAQSFDSPLTAPVVLPMGADFGHLVVTMENRTLGKLRLMIDTGAEKSLLSAKVAEKLKVDRHFTDQFYSFYGFGQGKKARLKGHTKLELVSGDTTLTTVDALVVDAENLDMGLNPAPDGILGWDFLQHLCVRLDAKGLRMTVGSEDHCATNEDGFYAPPVEWLQEGLLMPVTVTLTNGNVLKMKLHVDTGSDSFVLNPRLRPELGLEKKPQGEVQSQGKGMNGAYRWDLVNATSIVADGGHPRIEGKFPLLVPREGGYSQPNRFFGGKNEALMFHDGVMGNIMLGSFELIFDPKQKKLYERAYSYVAKTEQR